MPWDIIYCILRFVLFDILAGMGTVKTYFGLNEGTYCSPKAISALHSFADNVSLRAYSHPDNMPLKRVISEECGIDVAHIYLGHGSGPILRLGILHILEREIRSSYSRTLKYALKMSAYPVICTSATYSKVPSGLIKLGIPLRVVPLRAEDNFALDLELLNQEIRKGDGLVYIVNPNNPTGNILITK